MSNNDNRAMVSEFTPLARWEKPELRRLDAGAAEVAPNGNPDGGIDS